MDYLQSSSSSAALTLTTVAAILSSASALLLAFGTYYTYLTYDGRWWWKKRSNESGSEVCHQPNWEKKLIHGHVSPGWERVRDEFVQNFRARGELGAAVCVYHRGKKVVDLWGGYASRDTKAEWVDDTMVPIFSSTKGISAMALYTLASREELDLNEKVVTYWPEFGVTSICRSSAFISSPLNILPERTEPWQAMVAAICSSRSTSRLPLSPLDQAWPMVPSSVCARTVPPGPVANCMVSYEGSGFLENSVFGGMRSILPRQSRKR